MVRYLQYLRSAGDEWTQRKRAVTAHGLPFAEGSIFAAGPASRRGRARSGESNDRIHDRQLQRPAGAGGRMGIESTGYAAAWRWVSFTPAVTTYRQDELGFNSTG